MKEKLKQAEDMINGQKNMSDEDKKKTLAATKALLEKAQSGKVHEKVEEVAVDAKDNGEED